MGRGASTGEPRLRRLAARRAVPGGHRWSPTTSGAAETTFLHGARRADPPSAWLSSAWFLADAVKLAWEGLCEPRMWWRDPELRALAQYDDVEYWDKRYGEKPEVFEWYQNYTGLRSVLKKHLSLDAEILQVVPSGNALTRSLLFNSHLTVCLTNHLTHVAMQIGVGTSTLQADMVADGFKSVTSIDNSTRAIEILKTLHAECQELTYIVADCT